MPLTRSEADSVIAVINGLVPTPVVIPPPPPPVPKQVFAAPDIMDLDLTDEAAITRYIHPGWMSGPDMADKLSHNRAGTFEVHPGYLDPATGRPLHYFRAGGDFGTSERILNWNAHLGDNTYASPLAQFDDVREVWYREVVWFESDCLTGMNPAALGCKLSGIAMGGWASWVAEANIKNLPNANMPLYGYGYNKEGPQLIWNPYVDVDFAKALRPVTVLMHVKLNSAPDKHDGVAEQWVDGVPVFARRNVWFLDQPFGGGARVHNIEVQRYMGGTGNWPKGPCHTWVARIAISTKPIGPAPELPYVMQPVEWYIEGNEGATVTLPPNSIVRYGANGSFVTAKVSGTFQANNAFFKRDPAPWVGKTVSVWAGAGAAPAPEFVFP